MTWVCKVSVKVLFCIYRSIINTLRKPVPTRYIWFALLVSCTLKRMAAPKIKTFLASVV